MYSWRITKYNPENRDEKGTYLNLEEWTCFSEVGTQVSEEEYLRIELNYINAITTIMKEMNLDIIQLSGLEIWSAEVSNKKMTRFLAEIWVGKSITIQEVTELAKLTLRNEIWCKLSYEDKFFVHFGYDYYMYIGANVACLNARQKIAASGLFIECFHSPYQK